ncbi:MAG: hypothetical protein QM535_09790 [Limnohabitans sp.]|nr:hypothetical protein [Limnohabitans sp.]
MKSIKIIYVFFTSFLTTIVYPMVNKNNKIEFGDELISQYNFVNSIEKSCLKDYNPNCVLKKIKFKYRHSILKDTILFEKGSVKIILKANNKNELDYSSSLITYLNDKPQNSILFYKEKSGEYAVNNIYFYINNEFNFWLLNFFVDDEGTKIKTWTKYKIDSNNAKISLDEELIKDKLPYSTGEKPVIRVIKNNNMSISIQSILKKQLLAGYLAEKNETGYINYEYSLNDLTVTIPLLKNQLISNGYNSDDISDFESRIKTIFDKTIDPKSDITYVDFFDKCNNKVEYYPKYTENKYGVFIFKNQKFITEGLTIPQIIDYVKEYKDLANEEKKYERKYKNSNGVIITRTLWMDNLNLADERKKNIQLLVARNMYLFKNSRAHFRWLIINDENFMKNLIYKFGYFEDIELLEWVEEKFNSKQDNIQNYGGLFWTKQCDGKIKIHSSYFKLLQKKITKKNYKKYIEDIKKYIEYISDFTNKIDISNNDRIKIISNIVYFAEQYKYDSQYKSDFRIMGRSRYFLDAKNYRKILEQNNYFNLPKFKEWWERAEYDKVYVENCEYDGTCGPGSPAPNPKDYKH